MPGKVEFLSSLPYLESQKRKIKKQHRLAGTSEEILRGEAGAAGGVKGRKPERVKIKETNRGYLRPKRQNTEGIREIDHVYRIATNRTPWYKRNRYQVYSNRIRGGWGGDRSSKRMLKTGGTGGTMTVHMQAWGGACGGQPDSMICTQQAREEKDSVPSSTLRWEWVS